MPPNIEYVPHQSSIGIKYPKNRDSPNKSVDLWLEDKRDCDGAEGFWRIHDNLYDLTSFVYSHPGGKDWILSTKGTDITEAFETHHLRGIAQYFLPRFFIKKAKNPRNYPYTFHDDGFYKTLKKQVQEVLKDIPESLPKKSNRLTDLFLGTTFVLSILATYFWSYTLAIAAGYFLTCTVIAGHNYFHRKDNFRMYYFEFSLMSTRDWRISHALSHHLYTNSITDLEISSYEPIIEYLPKEKSLVVKYGSWLYGPLLWLTLYHISFIKRYIKYIYLRNWDGFRVTEFIPFALPITMHLVTQQPFEDCFVMWTLITLFGSFLFGLIGLNAAHHHPEIFHDGDAARPADKNDWGIHQLDAVMDRYDINGSYWLVLTNFGDHGLHHMFPTVDHAILEKLVPVFEKTTKQFNINLRVHSQIDMIKGQFQQLSRTAPNLEANYCDKNK